MERKERNIAKIVIIVVAVTITLVCAYLVKDMISDENNKPNEIEENEKPTPTPKPVNYSSTNDGYNVSIIKAFNNASGKENYLLSPYNIEVALNMLREGADANTKVELDNLLGNRAINDISVTNIIGIANALFIKENYKDAVKKDYYTVLDTKYHSEVIYDSFTSPTKINNWVKVKTNGMIEKILDQMSKDFVMGLASALAIDVKWADSFDCNNTESAEFTKINNEKISVQMMNKTYKSNAKYIKTSDAEGIVIPYRKEENSNVELEFVGILPNSDITAFINNLTSDNLNSIFTSEREAGEKLNINLSLPRFKYDYSARDFIGILKSLGINDAFDPSNANFKKMIETDANVYVGEAIHKTHIELNEVGTKAAAVTYVGMFKNSMAMPQEVETVNINFNKPFLYMIREKNTGEILFFGTVYEPNIWNGTTCEVK